MLNLDGWAQIGRDRGYSFPACPLGCSPCGHVFYINGNVHSSECCSRHICGGYELKELTERWLAEKAQPQYSKEQYTAYFQAEETYKAECSLWLIAQQLWEGQMRDWLTQEREYGRQCRIWLAAEQEFKATLTPQEARRIYPPRKANTPKTSAMAHAQKALRAR